ncbi:MAG: helix-turn-helix domain-containing protein [Bacteroidales bacterium]|nr:helix-turn-helix domain-containing protein [Candidatus Physcocola equi]
MNFTGRLFSFLLLFFFFSTGRAERILFAHYTVENGLGSNTVYSICQDRNGFVWMATHYGACRFDGVNFLNYNTSTNPSVCKNDLLHTFLLPNGKLTFSSSKAVLFSFNEDTRSFDDLSSFLPDDKFKYDIKGFSVQNNGEGLLATACGLYAFDNPSEQFHKVAPNYLNQVIDCCVDTFGRYWVGRFEGLVILDRQGNELQGSSNLTTDGAIVNIVFPIDDHHILVSSSAGSTWIANVSGAAELPAMTKVATPFKIITSVIKDKSGNLWVGTLGDGLWKCRFEGSQLSYEKIDPLNEDSDALQKISSLFCDNEGNIWVATMGMGVWKTTQLDACSYLKSKDLGFPVAVGASFCELDNGDVLFGTDGAGLYRFDSSFNLKRGVTGLSSNSILTMAKDEGCILLGYWGGHTNRFNPQTGKLSELEYKGIDNPFHTTKNILRANDGSIYVAATGDGVYHGVNNKWEKLLLMDEQMNNYPDLWFEGGCQKEDGTIYLYSARTLWSNRTGKYKPLFPDADQQLVPTPLHTNQCAASLDNELYAATNLGVYVFNKEDSLLGRLDYIPNGEYNSVFFDAEGVMWASGSCGILKIDVKNKTYESVIAQYDVSSADYFSSRACLQTTDGRIFFGCKDGFVCIQPKLGNVIHKDYMAFSELWIRGEKILTGSFILPTPLMAMDRLLLDYGQTPLSIGFDMADFSMVNKLTVKYRIVELDSAWIDLGQKRNIEIAYLPSGDFTVELASFSGVNMVQSKRLLVQVSPPWWQSGWFIFLMVFGLLAALYLVYRSRVRWMLERKKELEKMVNERTRDLNSANRQLEIQKAEIEDKNVSLLSTLKQKDQLVSVVAHDLKNPMFAIVSTLKRMKSRVYTPAEQQQLISQLTEESEGLQNQMINLLQWASGDAAQISCQPKPIDAAHLIVEAMMLSKGLADEKELELQLNGEVRFMTFADARMFSTIIRNLLTNAIKFSNFGGNIVVSLSENDSMTVVSVRDEGVGMSQDKIAELMEGANVTSTAGTENEVGFGFGFKMVLDYLHRNNGTINIESESGKGTTISIALPKSLQELEVKNAPNDVRPEVTIDKSVLQGKSILVVDDDPLILQHVTELLSPYVEILQAHDGVEGCQVAIDSVPDLIVSDVDMPNLNGLDMYVRLMENDTTSNIPLLFLSAKTDNNVRLKGLSIGAIDYIGKPFADEELLLKISNFLARQQKLQRQVLDQTLVGGESEVEPETINPLLEKIINLVKENYTNPQFSLPDIVQALGMSKATLCRRLKSITDKTPIEILTEYRLNLAKKLLSSEDMSVSEVAFAVGFNDPSYFSRRFKEFFGTSPKSAR